MNKDIGKDQEANSNNKVFKIIQKTDDTQIIISLNNFKESQYVDIRTYWKPVDKDYMPTKKGITISLSGDLSQLEEVIAALEEIKDFVSSGDKE